MFLSRAGTIPVMDEGLHQTADIAIVTPTAGEWQEMLKQISDLKKSPNWPLPVCHGRIGTHTVVCCATGKGQEETASAVTLLIERAKPRWLLLVGIAGGFPDQNVHRGDVVIAHVIHNFDYGKLVKGEFVRRPENDFNCDRSLLSWAEVAAIDSNTNWRTTVSLAQPESKSNHEIKVHSDCYIASSSKVVDDPNHDFYAKVKAAFPEIHAVEMEGTGAGASARLAQGERAIGLSMIRGISDEPGVPEAAGSNQRKLWRSYAAAAAAAFTRELLEQLPNRKVAVDESVEPSARILSGNVSLMDAISLALAKASPQHRVIFDRAIASASLAHRHADGAQVLERRIKKVLAPKLPKARKLPTSRSVVKIPTPYPDDIGEAGIITWSSGDQYVGQLNGKVESGLGSYIIYSGTREATPNAINVYRGEVFGDFLGPLGVYTWNDASEFAGEWADGRPHFGIKTFVDNDKWYDVYFGSFGTAETDRGPKLWVPHGYGIAFNNQEGAVRSTYAHEGAVKYLSGEIKVFP